MTARVAIPLAVLFGLQANIAFARVLPMPWYLIPAGVVALVVGRCIFLALDIDRRRRP